MTAEGPFLRQSKRASCPGLSPSWRVQSCCCLSLLHSHIWPSLLFICFCFSLIFPLSCFFTGYIETTGHIRVLLKERRSCSEDQLRWGYSAISNSIPSHTMEPGACVVHRTVAAVLVPFAPTNGIIRPTIHLQPEYRNGYTLLGIWDGMMSVPDILYYSGNRKLILYPSGLHYRWQQSVREGEGGFHHHCIITLLYTCCTTNLHLYALTKGSLCGSQTLAIICIYDSIARDFV